MVICLTAKLASSSFVRYNLSCHDARYLPELRRGCSAGRQSLPGLRRGQKAGWADDAYASSLNLPDESFDYDEFVDREFGKKKALPHGINWFWWVVAIVVVALFIFGMFKWIH